MKRYLFLLVFSTMFQSCFNPQEIKVKQDADIDQLVKLVENQHAALYGKVLKKEIYTADTVERKALAIDSSFFTYDFNIFDGKDIGVLFLNGGYTKSTSSDSIVYMKKEDEINGPFSLVLLKDSDGAFNYVKVISGEQNALFQTRTSYEQYYQQGALTSYAINGMQKLPGMSATTYAVKGTIASN